MSLVEPLKYVLPHLAASPFQEWMFRNEQFIPIFMLHRPERPESGIRGTDLTQLKRQLEWLRKNRWQAQTLDGVLEAWRTGEPLPSRTAVFTIDDGFEDQYQFASIFENYDYPLTYYVVTGFIEGNLWPWDDQVSYILQQTPLEHLEYCPYDHPDAACLKLPLGSADERRRAILTIREQLKQLPNSYLYHEIERLYRLAEICQPQQPPLAYRPMSWQQIRLLQGHGHSINPHTVSHRILSRLDDNEARLEIEKSWETFKQRTGIVPRTFAYPTGRRSDFSQREARYLEQLGCSAAVSTEPGHLRPASMIGQNRFALPRFAMPSGLADLCQYVSWIEKLKDDIRRR